MLAKRKFGIENLISQAPIGSVTGIVVKNIKPLLMKKKSTKI